jgi:phage-related protein
MPPLTLFAILRKWGTPVPAVEVVYYREGDKVPMAEWLAQLPPDACDVCIAHVRWLKHKGNEMRRPLVDFLTHGIYELRAKRRGVNYRMLHFFHGSQAVVVSHGFVKQRSRVPESEIRRALDRMARFKAEPVAHTFVAEI